MKTPLKTIGDAKNLVETAQNLVGDNPKHLLCQQIGSFKLILICQSIKKKSDKVCVEKLNIKDFHLLDGNEELTQPGQKCYNNLKKILKKEFKTKFNHENF